MVQLIPKLSAQHRQRQNMPGGCNETSVHSPIKDFAKLTKLLFIHDLEQFRLDLRVHVFDLVKENRPRCAISSEPACACEAPPRAPCTSPNSSTSNRLPGNSLQFRSTKSSPDRRPL